MSRGEELANLVVKAIAVKLKAMEDTGKGFHGEDVTMYDRLVVTLGTIARKYMNNILDTEPTESDVKKVVEIFDKQGVEITPEEVIVISKIWKFIAEKAKNDNSIVERVVDTEAEEGIYRKIMQKV